MSNVEVYVEEVAVKFNGDRQFRKEDLVLVVEWDDPNFSGQTVQAAIALEDIENGEVKSMAPTRGDEAALSNRIFKVNVEGTSVIEFTLLKREKLSGLGNLLGKLLNAGAVFGIGTATAGLGAVLAKKVVGELVQFKDKWEDKLGVSTVFVSDEGLPAVLRVPLKIDEDVAKALKKLYRDRDTQSSSAQRTSSVPDVITDLLAEDGPENGYVQLRIA